MPNGFKQYDSPIGPTQAGLPTASQKASQSGGFLPALGIAAIGAIGTYLSTKSQIKAQERMGERDWRQQLELERMRIEAQKELERMRHTLDPAVYAQLKKEILRPTAPHGMGASRPQTGAFRELLEPQSQRATPTGMPATPAPRGGRGFDLNEYFAGGRR